MQSSSTVMLGLFQKLQFLLHFITKHTPKNRIYILELYFFISLQIHKIMTKNNNNIKSVDVVCYQTHICIYSCIFVCAILILSHFHMIAKKYCFIFFIETKLQFFFCAVSSFSLTLYINRHCCCCQKRVLRETVEKKKKSSLWNAMKKKFLYIYKKSIVQTNIKKKNLYCI